MTIASNACSVFLEGSFFYFIVCFLTSLKPEFRLLQKLRNGTLIFEIFNALELPLYSKATNNFPVSQKKL